MNRNFTWSAALVIFCMALMVSSVFAQGAPTVTINKLQVSPNSQVMNVGEYVNYQIVIKNWGNAKFLSMTVSDFFTSQYLQYVSASPEPDMVAQEQGVISWTTLIERLGPLFPGQTLTISVTFKGIAESAVAPASDFAVVQVTDENQNRFGAESQKLYIQVVRGCPADRYEPNDSPRQMPEIKVGEKVNAYICPIGDEDYYKCSLLSAGIYKVVLNNLPDNFDLYVYDSGGAQMGSSKNDGTAAESFIVEAGKPMDISILVVGAKTFSQLPYQLQVLKSRTPMLGDGSVKPGGRLSILGEGLNPGTKRNPTIAQFYLNKVSPDLLLGSSNVLPDGRLAASVKTPQDTSGPNSIITQLTGAQAGVYYNDFIVQIPKVNFDVWIDDAWKSLLGKKPVVNKVVASNSGIWGRTKVDVVCNISPVTYVGSMRVQVSIENDLLGEPFRAYTRNGQGGDLTQIPWFSDGDGKYHANISSAAQQVVFRFNIPANTTPYQYIDVKGAAFDMEWNYLAQVNIPRQIHIVNGAKVAIFYNRYSLYRDMDDNEVAHLLGDIYTHSQENGKLTPQDKRAIIYNLDNYIGHAFIIDWDNTAVNYDSTESTRNMVAIYIRHFMRDRFQQFIAPSLRYVMIVGNDEQFPMYRHLDPSGDEQNWASKFAGGDKGNPALRACFKNCLLTDDFYASLVNVVTDAPWKEGDVDLVIGRIIGDSAEDMRQLYLNGHYETGHTFRSVMASVDGWELGYAPSAGGPGEISDYTNVPQRMIDRAFSVFRDTETPRTIDVLAPYASNWATKFQESANGGMDLFFIGGHNSYTGASLPSDGFDPADIPSKYNRFDDDRPIVMITGCHGGLPVPNVGWGGGVNSSMVYNVIHNGARAYFGASGYSYGSPGSLQHCTFAERYLQMIFWRIFNDTGDQSYPIGDSIKWAKTNWIFGIGNDNNLDKKTVTEFNLFGIPWQRLNYPYTFFDMRRGKEDKKPPLPKSLEQKKDLALAPRSVKQLAANTYQQSFEVAVENYTPAKYEGFEIINVPDGVQQYINKAPLLPAITKYSLILPEDGKIIEVATKAKSDDIGQYNIPTVLIGPWTESGVELTEKTNIDEFYPKELAQYTKTADGHYLFSVFPIQHNPTSDETVFHSLIQVTITYETEHPYGIASFAPTQTVFNAAQNPAFDAEVFNMGDKEAELTGKMSIHEETTDNVVAETYLALTIQPGTVYNLNNSLPAPLPEGDYSAWLQLAAASDYPATATASFAVRKVYLADLAAEYDRDNNEVQFKVRAVNRTPKGGMVYLSFLVSQDDTPLYSSKPDEFGLKGDTETTFTLKMMHEADVYGIFRVEAIGSFEETPLDSVNGSLAAYPYKILLNELIDHILGRAALAPEARKVADMNKDGKIDAADIVLLIGELK